MNHLSHWSLRRLVGVIAAWLCLVLVAWLFTPGGQAVIELVWLAYEAQGPFTVEVPVHTINLWWKVAALVAGVPSVVLTGAWVLARRSPHERVAA